MKTIFLYPSSILRNRLLLYFLEGSAYFMMKFEKQYMENLEKRKTLRRKILFTVEITEKFLVMELSSTGMKILSDFRLPPGLEVPFMLHLGKESVPIIAESVWCKRLNEGVHKRYEVGFKFLKLSQRTLQLIDEYIEE